MKKILKGQTFELVEQPENESCCENCAINGVYSCNLFGECTEQKNLHKTWKLVTEPEPETINS